MYLSVCLSAIFPLSVLAGAFLHTAVMKMNLLALFLGALLLLVGAAATNSDNDNHDDIVMNGEVSQQVFGYF